MNSTAHALKVAIQNSSILPEDQKKELLDQVDDTMTGEQIQAALAALQEAEVEFHDLHENHLAKVAAIDAQYLHDAKLVVPRVMKELEAESHEHEAAQFEHVMSGLDNA